MENHELQTAWNIISRTDTHLFLTGKAGTGKTTFLKDLRQALPKRMVVVAPTGIAAINAQGTTIHSFFQLGFGPQLPGVQQKTKRYQFRKQNVRLIRSLDLVVIDEISMVRADVLDAIDNVLRQYRHNDRPFGGVQMLMIGDMQQLAPVAKEEEWRLLSPYYDTPYFFSSKALQQTDFVTVELKHVYRQTDSVFLDLLNQVRTNTADDVTLKKLNERYIPDFVPSKEDGYIRLMTHNKQADEINQRELNALTTPPSTFEAHIEGDFPEMSYPTELQLTLKEGAQVMFIKNDSSLEKEYYNGMIGEVVEIAGDDIIVRAVDTDAIIKVGREKWENTKYELDEDTKEIREEVVGTFLQYPLKTAWAITVHKSQGLTFEHAIIDVQHSFAHGQTYVALSRCKTLEGMVLSAPIPRSAIISDITVSRFANDPRHQEPDEKRLDLMQRQYLLRVIEELFSFVGLRYRFNEVIRFMREHFYDSYNSLYKEWVEAAEKFKLPESVAVRFHAQYQNLVMTEPIDTQDNQLQERLRKGAAYFKKEIVFVWDLLKKTNIKTNNKQIRERLDNMLQGMKDEYKMKTLLFSFVEGNGLVLKDYLNEKAKMMLSLDEKDVPVNNYMAAKPKKVKLEKISNWAKKYVATENSSENNGIDHGTDDSTLPY